MMPQFSYDRDWDSIYEKLQECKKKQSQHLQAIKAGDLTRKQMMYHLRQFKGLEGAVCTLRWVMGDGTVDPAMGVLQ